MCLHTDTHVLFKIYILEKKQQKLHKVDLSEVVNIGAIFEAT